MAYFIRMHRFLPDELKESKMFLLAQAQQVKPSPEAFVILTQAQCLEYSEFQKQLGNKFQYDFALCGRKSSKS